jgi:hypothetical protein
MTSPVFVAKFADGEVTRMTTYAGRGLSFARGVRLARAAYESRTKRTPPPIVEAHYECDDNAIERYDAEGLGAVP